MNHTLNIVMSCVTVCTRVRVGWLLALVAVSSSTACLRLNPNHCLVNGGDAACGEEICVVGTGLVLEHMDRGCIEAVGYIPSGFVRVEYGLPSRLGSRDDVNDLDSVVGAMVAAMDHARSPFECETSEESLAFLVDPWARAAEVRYHLDRSGRVREESVLLTSSQASAIFEFSGAVDAVIENCAGGEVGGSAGIGDGVATGGADIGTGTDTDVATSTDTGTEGNITTDDSYDTTQSTVFAPSS